MPKKKIETTSLIYPPLKKQKSAFRTTEFWANAIMSAGSVVAATQDVLDPKWAALVAAVSNGAYIISRGLRKARQN